MITLNNGERILTCYNVEMLMMSFKEMLSGINNYFFKILLWQNIFQLSLLSRLASITISGTSAIDRLILGQRSFAQRN